MINLYNAERIHELQVEELERKHRLVYRTQDIVETGRRKAAELRPGRGGRGDGMLARLVRRLSPRPGAARKTYA